MCFFNLFNRFGKAKHNATRLPSDWPSWLHNKCNMGPKCYFPNSPQAAEGIYECLADGCKGTYEVTYNMAVDVMLSHKNGLRQQEAKRTAAETDREKAKVVQYKERRERRGAIASRKAEPGPEPSLRRQLARRELPLVNTKPRPLPPTPFIHRPVNRQAVYVRPHEARELQSKIRARHGPSISQPSSARARPRSLTPLVPLRRPEQEHHGTRKATPSQRARRRYGAQPPPRRL